MKPKKNPKADLNKNRSLYFVIGLCVILFVSWRAIEWKTYEASNLLLQKLNIDDDDDEEVPLTEQLKTPPPPPPPPAPEIIEIVEDEEEVEETIIEDVPIYPGCERVAKDKRRDCFQEKIQRHISKNFRYPEIAREMGISGRVYVQFVISKSGEIVGIRTRGPDKNLEKEAQRIIGKLPKMTPGKQRGRPVRVPFSIPISFRLQ